MENASKHSQEIDFNRISHKKVRKFVLDYGLTTVGGFSKMTPLCYKSAEKESYREHHKTFVIRESVDFVWDTYVRIHPKDAWNGEMVSFGLQYSQRDQTINYLNDDYPGMQEGQILILNLTIFWGMLNIAVAHQVAEVDEKKHLIKLCYMKGGASEGSQWITLKATEEGFTEVSHLTLYKSKSDFRDTRLYPALHTKAISEFHLNVKKRAESRRETVV